MATAIYSSGDGIDILPSTLRLHVESEGVTSIGATVGKRSSPPDSDTRRRRGAGAELNGLAAAADARDKKPPYRRFGYPLQLADVLDDLVAKLDRAGEHIDTLKGDIARLLQDVPSRPITEYDPQAQEGFQNELSGAVVPVRTRIIAGDAIHQVRSSLDHLVAKLVAKNNADTDQKAEFPIQPYRRVKTGEIGRYEAKVRCVADAAKALMESLQPYNRATPFERRTTT